MNYRPEIDGLRAVAIISVILFHTGLEPFSGGFVGVDVFFVISGYLITKLVHGEIASDRFSLVRFYERRARRILPALFLICLISLAVGWWILLPDQFAELGSSIVAVLVFALVPKSTPGTLEMLRGTQQRQRATMQLISDSGLRQLRGFQVESALFCSGDPNPFPTMFTQQIMRRGARA